MARRNDVSTKLDAVALDKARTAASLRHQSVAEFLSDAVLLAAQKVLDDFAVQRASEIQAIPMASRDEPTAPKPKQARRKK